jgi:prevent-host-death family protein
MKTTWPLQDAKNRFSEVIEQALKHGPQTVTRRGKETAVIISVQDYRKMQQPDSDFVGFMRKSPLSGLELDFKRSKDDTGREVDL